MKQQNDHTKTKHYTAYTDSKPSHVRRQEAIESIPKHCWWMRQYLRGLHIPNINRRQYELDKE